MYLFVIALLLLFAQDAPMTNLSVTGDESSAFTTSDTNACYIDPDNNALNAQLFGDASLNMILSFTVLGTVGDHPATGQLGALTLDGPPADPFVSWQAISGTITLDDVAAEVPIETGDTLIAASTHGVVGHVDADLMSPRGNMHVSGPFACHSPL
jgi:hypothetical protein